MKKHFLLCIPQIILWISGILKKHNLFWSSNNFSVWSSPGHRFCQTTVLFFSKEHGNKDYSLVIRQQDHKATLLLYAKQVVLSPKDGDVSDHELLLLTITLGSDSTEGGRKIIPNLHFQPGTVFGQKQTAIITDCMELIPANKSVLAHTFDFKTPIVMNDDILPPPDLRELFKNEGLITSERSKRA